MTCPSSSVLRFSHSRLSHAPVKPVPSRFSYSRLSRAPVQPVPSRFSYSRWSRAPVHPTPTGSSRPGSSRPVPVPEVSPGGAARHNSATCRPRRAPPGTGESLTHSGRRDPGDPPRLGDLDPSRLEGPRGLSRAGDPDHIFTRRSRVRPNRDRAGCWASSGCWASAGGA